MLEIKLETTKGEEVASALMPPFQSLPEVVIWGLRVFMFNRLAAAVPVYRECFAWCVPVSELARAGGL
jgi:hypothetical protein